MPWPSGFSVSIMFGRNRIVVRHNKSLAYPVPEQIGGAPLDFAEDARHVFANNAQRRKVHAREKKNHRNQGRPALDRVAVYPVFDDHDQAIRSEEHTSELPSLMRISYAVFCLKNKHKETNHKYQTT